MKLTSEKGLSMVFWGDYVLEHLYLYYGCIGFYTYYLSFTIEPVRLPTIVRKLPNQSFVWTLQLTSSYIQSRNDFVWNLMVLWSFGAELQLIGELKQNVLLRSLIFKQMQVLDFKLNRFLICFKFSIDLQMKIRNLFSYHTYHQKIPQKCCTMNFIMHESRLHNHTRTKTKWTAFAAFSMHARICLFAMYTIATRSTC